MKEWINQYRGGTYQERTLTQTVASFGTNLVLGLGKLALGLYLLSPWFIANAIYYLLLCFARGYVLRKYKAIRQITDAKQRYDREFAVYRDVGVSICLLGLSYLLVCLRMYFAGDSTAYNAFYLVYGVATLSFTKLGFAIYGTKRARHMSTPMVSALKVFNVTDAFVSIVVTECALLSMQQTANAARYSAITGRGVSALFMLEGVLMLRKKPKYSEAEARPGMANNLIRDEDNNHKGHPDCPINRSTQMTILSVNKSS